MSPVGGPRSASAAGAPPSSSGGEAASPLCRDETFDEAVTSRKLAVTLTPAREGPKAGKLGLAFGLHPTTAQVMVKRLWDGYPALAAGLRVGDVILEIGGHALETVEAAYELCASLGGGRPVQLRAARLRCIRNVRLCKVHGGKFGITFGEAPDVKGRVIILTLYSGYPAVESGELDRGDAVLAVNGRPVATPDAARRICCAAEEFVELRTVSRNMRGRSSVGG